MVKSRKTNDKHENNWNNFAELISFEEITDYKIRGEQKTESDLSENEKELVTKCEKNKQNTKKPITNTVSGKRELASCKETFQPKKKMRISSLEDAASDSPDPDNRISLEEMNAWNPFNLPAPIMNALAFKKFTQPTKIQELVLPQAIFKRKNVLGAAETGSGKTLAFAIPIVTSLLEAENEGIDINGKLWALIVTPTRELAIQVKKHIQDLCKFTNIKIQEIVGGLSIEKQNRKLKEKPQIIVGTPGRLWELIRNDDAHLSRVHEIKFFVIDEADRMFEKNHFQDFPHLLERLSMADKSQVEKRQTFVFSATLTVTHQLPSYVLKKKKKKKTSEHTKNTADDKLQTFINSLGLRNPAVIDITRQNVLASGISESCILCTVDEKDYYLYYLLRVHAGKKIIFANSVTCVKRLQRLLNILQCNPKVLFADMAQNQRLKNLDNFQKHANSLLLATDVAARGLDIPNIDYIIHYQVPKTSEIYVHRSGRSVRGASARGTSIILCSPAENYHHNKIMKTLEKKNKVPAYNVSQLEIFSLAKKAVDIGRKIEQLESKVHNIQSNASWVEKCAKEMDILLDEDEKPEKLDDSTRRSIKSEIKKLRLQLEQLLKRPVLPLQESLRYPQFAAVQTFIQQCIINKN